MNDAEWHQCVNPAKLLLFLQGKGATPWFARSWFADRGLATSSAPPGPPLRKLRLTLEALGTALPDGHLKAVLLDMPPRAAWRWAFGEDRLMELVMHDVTDPRECEAWRKALAQRGPILREIFANPFRSLTQSSLPLSESAARLAQSIDAEAAFDRLPILADAIEECGCQDAGLLEHLRGPESHRRGCWALDRVLGLE